MFSSAQPVYNQALSFAGRHDRFCLDRRPLISYLTALTKRPDAKIGLSCIGEGSPVRFYRLNDPASYIDVSPHGKPLTSVNLTPWARFLGMGLSDLAHAVRTHR